ELAVPPRTPRRLDVPVLVRRADTLNRQLTAEPIRIDEQANRRAGGCCRERRRRAARAAANNENIARLRVVALRLHHRTDPTRTTLCSAWKTPLPSRDAPASRASFKRGVRLRVRWLSSPLAESGCPLGAG